MNGESARAGASATLTTPRTVPLDLLVAVARYLLAHPNASAWEVARDVRGRRSDVLRLVRLVRASGVVGTSPAQAPPAGTGSPGTTRCPACDVALEIRTR